MPADSSVCTVICGNAMASAWMMHVTEKKEKWFELFHKSVVCIKIMGACLTLFKGFLFVSPNIGRLNQRYVFVFYTTSWSAAFLFLEKVTWLSSGAAGASRRHIFFFFLAATVLYHGQENRAEWWEKECCSVRMRLISVKMTLFPN